MPVYTPVVGAPRLAAPMRLHIVFATAGLIRVPFREFSKDGEHQRCGTSTTGTGTGTGTGTAAAAATSSGTAAATGSGSGAKRRPGLFDISFARHSAVTYTLPAGVLGPDGYAAVLELALDEAALVPSHTGAAMVTAEALAARIVMRYPREWNGLYDWEYGLEFRHPRVFMLYDHVYVINDIIKDWMFPGDAVPMERFMPMIYRYNIRLVSYEIILNVNEKNVIESFNDFENNAHFVLAGPVCDIGLTMPWTRFGVTRTDQVRCLF
jgi:hypothetical protein